MCTVYILYSSQLNRYYIGHTCDEMDERMRKHLTAHKGFTARAKDWEILYTEIHLDKSSAYRRELEIKGWKSSKKIRILIAEQ
ncbi:GIY-YIG nuclease family protein [Gelidibacter maritimus]|uniref:GIY-YIG nuclease family protein n=1 Tax=Gelidibacter maritimus TaxID=2761487 RepID=A0A7W2R4Z4_9FLAO|nr:GIY-YIG nuclease family protein [Gelidibacter maritimus]MBA6154213.1 GIY-YIG nuclease family protein [Gelidibacter maritimus]